jgi:hypothetical protein
MAQGAVASLPVNGTTTLTAEDIHEILECEKIIRFRDAVLSGNHPRIKVPLHLTGKSAARHASSPSSLTPRPNPPASQGRPTTNTPTAQIEGNHSGYNSRPSNTQRPPGRTTATMPMAVKAEINPILLEKSDDLIKAEIQLQRQRLERALGEQVTQRRLSQKAALQTSESLPDFDISDVLSKALTIVHPSTAAEAEQTVGDHASASDSFDENTFYSSQHDTPEHSSASHEHRPPADISAHDVALATLHTGELVISRDGDEPGDVVVPDVSLSSNVDSGVQEPDHKPSPSLQHSSQRISQSRPLLGLNETDSTSRDQTNDNYRQDMGKSKSRYKPGPSATVNSLLNGLAGISSHPPKQIADLANVQSGPPSELNYGELAPSTYPEILEPAIIRTREDVPTLAPQPARVSPLATARAPPILGQSMIAEEGTPAQVVALRKSAGSSQDSSSKGTKPADKKKNKKNKKRKSSGKQPATIETPELPYIKPEPRSPSPILAAPLPRPLKRQRQTLEAGPGLNYDDPSYDIPREEAREQMLPPRYKDHGPRRVYDRVEDERPYEPRETEPYTFRRVGRDERQHRRLVSHEEYREPQIYREPVSPSMHTLPYSSNEPRAIRAVSHAVTERRIQEPSRYYTDLPPRASVRIDSDRDRSRSPVMRDRPSPIIMAPPRLPPARIVVDEFGNQYAPIPVASRQSVVPVVRPSEDNRTYERAPLRPVARPPTDVYEEDGIVYRKSTPSLSAMRRVITQPEQEIDYRSYRQRDYSVRPETRAPPSEEYVRIREPVERRQMSHLEEAPREYARVGSVRPESVRYAAPREYVTRVQSVRPEALPHVHASSVRPEPRREIATQPFREFSVRPNDPEIIRREYMPPRGTSYAPTRPVARRVVDDAEYVEKQGEVPQDLYMEDVRREVVYR